MSTKHVPSIPVLLLLLICDSAIVSSYLTQAQSFRAQIPPGTGISVTRAVGGQRITLIVPAGTPLAELSVSTADEKSFEKVPPLPELAIAAAVHIAAYDAAGKQIEQSTIPLLLALTFPPRANVVPTAYEKLQLYAFTDAAHYKRLKHRHTRNSDGTITVSTELVNFGVSIVIFVPPPRIPGTGLTNLTRYPGDDTAPSWGPLGIIVFDSFRMNN